MILHRYYFQYFQVQTFEFLEIHKYEHMFHKDIRNTSLFILLIMCVVFYTFWIQLLYNGFGIVSKIKRNDHNLSNNNKYEKKKT